MKPTQHTVRLRHITAVVGFTLIEFAIVIALMGILGIIAMPKMLTNPATTLDSQVKTFAADLRRIQLLASVRGSSVCISASGQNYYAYPCSQPTTRIIDPSTGQNFDVTFKNAIYFTNPAIVPALEFNSLGQPNRSVTYIITPTGSTTSLHVTVTALTGYISMTATP